MLEARQCDFDCDVADLEMRNLISDIVALFSGPEILITGEHR